jgi:hypothetical protein
MRSINGKRTGLIWTLLLASVSPSWGEELEGSLSVAGNRITVQALREDRSPANNAAVRLVRDGKTIVEGRINHQGFWVTEAAKAGAYEIWLGDPKNEDELTKMPITIAADLPLDAVRPPCCVGPFLSRTDFAGSEASAPLAPPAFPWLPAALGASLLVMAAVLLRRFKADARARAAAMSTH